MGVTKISYEESLELKKKFNARHPESMHRIYHHSPQELSSVERKMHFLINTQNGQDVDDYVVDDNSPLLKYFTDSDLHNKSMLLIGTGVGREVITAQEMGASVVKGTTLGQRNKAYAKEIVGVDLEVCDMHAMPWPNEAFDLVCGFQVLEHSFMPVMFMLECHRLLKTGGMVCFETPPSKTISLDSWLHHVICPTPRQMYYLFIKTGFKPVWFNGVDISNMNPDDEEVEIEGFDDTSIMVCMKAIRQDPRTYPRGDMLRYYYVLAGNDFSY